MAEASMQVVSIETVPQRPDRHSLAQGFIGD
jgi:hypothetical protein